MNNEGDRHEAGEAGSGLIAVIVLSYNDRKWLDRCITSVLESEDDDFRVFLVDNASTDGSADFVAQAFPAVTVVRNPANLGFAAGNNVGIKVAREAGAVFVILLNSDTWVERAWLKELRRVFAEAPTIDVATAMILDYDSSRFDRNFSQIVRSIPEFVQDVWDGRTKAWYETSTGSGAALMAKTSFFEGVGAIDPVFFMYFEELDLLRRGRYFGKKSAVSTRSIVHHYNHLESLGSGKPSKIRFERGFLIYTLKDQFAPLPKCVIKFLLETVSRPVGAVFRGEWKRAALLIRTGCELLLKSPWIIYRRHLEMREPDRLPEMEWLRPSGNSKSSPGSHV